MRRTKWGSPRRYRPRRFHFTRLWLIFPLLVLLLVLLELSLAPVLETYAFQRAHSQALLVMNQAINREINANPAVGDYQQLMHIERDGEGRITLLVPDTLLINDLMSDVVAEIDSSLKELEDQDIVLPLGSATGSSLLAGLGPDLKIAFRAMGAPTVAVEDEFTGAGINQVRHSIYINVECNIRVVVPFMKGTDLVSVKVLLAEGIIVGYTPDTYVDLSGVL